MKVLCVEEAPRSDRCTTFILAWLQENLRRRYNRRRTYSGQIHDQRLCHAGG